MDAEDNEISCVSGEDVLSLINEATKHITEALTERWASTGMSAKHAAIVVGTETADETIYSMFLGTIAEVISELERLSPGTPENIVAAIKDEGPCGGPHRLSVYFAFKGGSAVVQLTAITVPLPPPATNPLEVN